MARPPPKNTRRPREGRDPYAVSLVCWIALVCSLTAVRHNKRQGLWGPRLREDDIEDVAPAFLIQPLPAVGHRIEKRAGLAIEKLDIRRDRAARGGMPGHGAGADGFHRRVRDVLAHLDR